MQNSNEAKLRAAECLKFLESGGGDGKSIQPALDEINLKLGKIDDRIKKVTASETILSIKIEKLFYQTIANVEQEQDLRLLEMTHRLTPTYLPITKV